MSTSTIQEQIANNAAQIVELDKRKDFFHSQIALCVEHKHTSMATYWRKEIRRANAARKFHVACIIKLTEQLEAAK